MAKILIIDDSVEARNLVGRFLSAKGFDVSTADDGVDGVAKARLVLPDLILMDLNMPVMTGFEATRQLKSDQTLKHIPVVALSAESDGGSRDEIYEAGCEGFVSKPIDFPRLVPTIEKFLDS